MTVSGTGRVGTLTQPICRISVLIVFPVIDVETKSPQPPVTSMTAVIESCDVGDVGVIVTAASARKAAKTSAAVRVI